MGLEPEDAVAGQRLWEIEKPFGMGLNDIIMTVNADMDSSLLLIYIHIYSCPYDVSVDMSVRAFEGSSRSLTCSFQIPTHPTADSVPAVGPPDR